MNLIERVFSLFKSTFARLSHALGQQELKSAIDSHDPVGSALSDATLLIAFAAQSRRSIKKEKVEALTKAVGEITATRNAGSKESTEQITAFWLAYDNLAVDMAPLSAHSIRSSTNINEKRFPASLTTPTAIHASFAIFIFFICIALQMFWAAGKELVERADALEIEKTDIQKVMALNDEALQRINGRKEILEKEKCGGDCWDVSPADKPDQKRLATLNAEIKAIEADLNEKNALAQGLREKLEKINERSRPLENLLREWHERAQLVCGINYLKFLCPVDNLKNTPTMEEIENIKKRIVILKAENTQKAEDRLAKLNLLRLNIQIKRDEEEVRKLTARQNSDVFRSIAVEVHLIVANISTYLIAMAMGILGALTFILRTMSHQIQEHTYVPVSASVTIVRVCLGAIAGVFGSLLMTVPGADASFKNLPPLFIPFVLGYGIEILFSVLDKVVRSFTQPEPANSQPAS